MAAARVRQVKTLEKVVLGIRACSVEKLQQLNSEFIDHQDWLRQTIADTKEHKDALGLVCPRTTRKATKAKSVVGKALQQAEASNKEDQENIENGATAKPARKGRGKSKAPLGEAAPDNDDLSVFDPEEVSEAEAEAHPAKQPKGRKGGKQARQPKEKSEQPEEKAPKEPEPEPEAPVEEEKKAPIVTCHKPELQKLKVVELRSELQQRGLPMAGAKADLIDRLNAAMVAEDFRGDASRKKLLVGREIRPVLGMRVVHVLGTEHGSSRGLFGTVEYIPGRGGNPNERSVSVRWAADLSDVRGPYYTGESCDRGSGVGDAKYDLYCIDDADQDLFPEGATDGILGLQAEERETEDPAFEEERAVEEEKEEEEKEDQREEAGEAMEEEEEEEEEGPDEESAPIEATPVRGNGSSKRTSESPPADEPAEKKRKPSPPVAASPEPQRTPTVDASEAVPAATALMEKLGAVRSAWAEREAAAPAPAPAPKQQQQQQKEQQPEATPPAAAEAQPAIMVQPASTLKATPDAQPASVNASVESFRAILNRIHSGHTPTFEQPASTPASSTASASASASRASAPRVLSMHKPTEQQEPAPAPSGSAFARTSSANNKSGTWPIAQPQQAYKAAADPFAHGKPQRDSRGSGQGYSALTSEALSAHVQSQGMVDPVQLMGGKGGQAGSSVPKVLDVRVSQATNAAQQQRVLDAASRQQRAAENRARMEDDKKKQLMEQEKRRREAETKRVEAERIANERRQREIQAQAEKAEAARVRALQEEERKMRAALEEEQRRAQQQREAEKLRAAQAAQQKPAVPVFAPSASPAMSSGQPNSASKGIFGAIGGFVKGVGSVFGGQEPAQQQQVAGKEEVRHPPESGPTSIQIQMEKNSDESDEDEDEERKQQPPVWARSPNLRLQIERQANMSPTPIFGECKKTCDLGHIFQNHQPKRRKYDKRTSSADWGDVDNGRASYMEEERFQRQMIQNMAMQHAGKGKY